MKLTKVFQLALLPCLLLGSISTFARDGHGGYGHGHGGYGHGHGHGHGHGGYRGGYVETSDLGLSVSTFASTALLSSVGNAHLAMNDVKSDAQDFLEAEEGRASDKLVAVFIELKQYEEFSKASDLELASLIITTGTL